LAALAIGDLPEPEVPEGWLRIKISHASLNRHDIFTLPTTSFACIGSKSLPGEQKQLNVISQ
jgi:NADPH:quinone reductase-like Zn-dependent oxidoreductase